MLLFGLGFLHEFNEYWESEGHNENCEGFYDLFGLHYPFKQLYPLLHLIAAHLSIQLLLTQIYVWEHSSSKVQ